LPKRCKFEAVKLESTSKQVFHSKEEKRSDRFGRPGLLELIALRAGQLHTSGPCINCYSKMLWALGESSRKMAELEDWKISTAYDPAERVALELCEAICADPDAPVLERLLHEAQGHFTKDEILKMTLCVLAIGDLHECGNDV
jgi:alkylhydroperoxidase family enzyme